MADDSTISLLSSINTYRTSLVWRSDLSIVQSVMTYKNNNNSLNNFFDITTSNYSCTLYYDMIWYYDINIVPVMFDFITTGLLFISKLLCYIKFLTARLLTNIALRARSGHEPNPKIDVCTLRFSHLHCGHVRCGLYFYLTFRIAIHVICIQCFSTSISNVFKFCCLFNKYLSYDTILVRK